MARLYPAVKPYTILETTAGFYKMHGAVAALAAVVCFLLQLSEWQIALITFVATVGGYFMAVYATYPPGLVRIARLYSLLTGYGLVLVGLSVAGLLTVGVVGTAAFWLSRLLAEAVTMAHTWHLGRQVSIALLHGMPTRGQEHAGQSALVPDGFALRCFGNAYATYATMYGAPIEPLASQNELESQNWRNVLKEFAHEWPEVARRFGLSEEEWKDVLQVGRAR